MKYLYANERRGRFIAPHTHEVQQFSRARASPTSPIHWLRKPIRGMVGATLAVALALNLMPMGADSSRPPPIYRPPSACFPTPPTPWPRYRSQSPTAHDRVPHPSR